MRAPNGDGGGGTWAGPAAPHPHRTGAGLEERTNCSTRVGDFDRTVGSVATSPDEEKATPNHDVLFGIKKIVIEVCFSTKLWYQKKISNLYCT